MIIGIPRSTYEERRALFLDYYSENGSGHPLYGVFRQAARAASGRPLEMDKMREVISVIKSNRDCNDFTLNCLLRMVYLDKKQSFLPTEIKEALKSVFWTLNIGGMTAAAIQPTVAIIRKTIRHFIIPQNCWQVSFIKNKVYQWNERQTTHGTR